MSNIKSKKAQSKITKNSGKVYPKRSMKKNCNPEYFTIKNVGGDYTNNTSKLMSSILEFSPKYQNRNQKPFSTSRKPFLDNSQKQ